MSKLIVLVGLPGSGKSYVAKNEFSNCKVFSSDAYRLLVCGDESCQDRNQEVFTQLYKDLRIALQNGEDCVFDATNVTRKDRARIFNQIRGINNIEVVAYVMRTPVTVCLDRDSQRTRKVGFEVIDKFVRRFEFPQRFEGFSDIVIDREPQESMSLIESRFYQLLEDMKDWDQRNPHHVNNLYDHAYLLADHFPKDSAEFYAGILHDVGKMIVNHCDDQGIVHYYNHDSVGAYYILSYLYEYLIDLEPQSFFEYLMFLVNYHMKGHKDIRSMKSEEKYRKLFGDKWYDSLIKFANADIEASGTESIHELLEQWIKVDKLTLEEIRIKPEYVNLIEQAKRKKVEYVTKTRI